jgi:arylsulfatase A-like enzyme
MMNQHCYKAFVKVKICTTGVKSQAGINNALVELVDFSATVYDLLDIDPGYDHFGCSLLPVIAGELDEHRDAVK